MIHSCYDLDKMTINQIEQMLKTQHILECRQRLEGARLKKRILMVNAVTQNISLVEPRVVLAETKDEQYLKSAGTNKTAGFAVTIGGRPLLFGFHDFSDEIGSLMPEDDSANSLSMALQSKGYSREEFVASLFLALPIAESYRVLANRTMTVSQYFSTAKILLAKNVNLFIADPRCQMKEGTGNIVYGSFVFPGPAQYIMNLEEKIDEKKDKKKEEISLKKYQWSVNYWAPNQSEFRENSYANTSDHLLCI